ncbi:cellobiose PTS, EIIC [Kandleria vitulina DSM 20405]|uniref:Permease IIC component n=1 Tax=Kandleria vitulina DSM 20405 TaxID=1410657 RepID=A0A0R2HJP9_9FIRM|nr:PTS transporter subunit EIIC [Kandleria vitulina]KRN50172.1 cellobiose PTS, EIIC [Kandleria vitulina DSM 20405]
MDKMQNFMEKYFVPLAAVINGQRHVAAVRDAFTLTFPLTMAGSIVLLINYVFLDPSGFVASLLHLDKLIPNLASYQSILSSVINGTTNIIALIIAFLVAYQLAQEMKGDSVLCGITSLAVYFILYPGAKDFADKSGSGLSTTYFGAQGLFVALIFGLITAEILCRLGRCEKLRIKMPDMVPPAVAQSFNLLIPIMIVMALSGVVNFVFSHVTTDGIQVIIYNAIQSPMTSLGNSMGTILVFVVVQQFLWVLGIHGPNTLSALRSVIWAEQGNANLVYVAHHGSAWGCPYPVNFTSINDAFGNGGGSGATLGLIIAIFIVGRRNKTQYSIAKMSLLPGIFNINEPIIFGLPIVMNPMYLIPFILTPIACDMIGYFAVAIVKIIPPIAYSVAWTTPEVLTPFLGSGANNFMSLVVGVLCLGVSVLIYLPFVMASNKAALMKGAKESES